VSIIREYFDGKAERDAEKLLQADLPVIRSWEQSVRENITKRHGRWANVAYLRMARVRRYA
jgi:hypothetical protein